jgi:hypothetical protein
MFESVVVPGVATETDPLLSWASLPFKVLPELSVVEIMAEIRRPHS